MFVTPARVIGDEDASLVFDGKGEYKFASQGSLVDWQQHVAALALDNTRLEFALGVAFAAPLLFPLQIDGGGFHYWGGSSTGKTTAAQMGASVYGSGDSRFGFVQSLRATDNALEFVAHRHNHVGLFLDEIAQLEKAGKSIYTLVNGQGKGRSKTDGDARPRSAWNMMFLSTGEISIEDKIASEGDDATAGQLVRIINIAADAGSGHGVHDALNGLPNGAALSDRIKQATATYYGTAFPAYVEYVAANFDMIASRRDEVDAFAAGLTPRGADGQVGRAMQRFALVAFAGKIAIETGVLSAPWTAEHFESAARKLAAEWIEARGGMESSEALLGARRIMAMLSRDGLSRFAREDTQVVHRFSGGLRCGIPYVHRVLHHPRGLRGGDQELQHDGGGPSPGRISRSADPSGRQESAGGKAAKACRKHRTTWYGCPRYLETATGWQRPHDASPSRRGCVRSRVQPKTRRGSWPRTHRRRKLVSRRMSDLIRLDPTCPT